MVVHCELEARPEEHVRGVDVALRDWNLLALELKRELLVEADTEEKAEAVVGGVGKVFCVCCAEREGRTEDGGKSG